MRRLLLVLIPTLLISVFASRTAKSAKPPAAESGGPRRVVLLSIEAAGGEELQRVQREGVFGNDGFARFFREGQVAERLIPVDPTLTAPNHTSLATGYPPSRTGIVGNTIYRASAPFLETVSGFASPIGTETLWEAARRQGRRVATVGWVGADFKSERRRPDWGMDYVNDPDRKSGLVVLENRGWEPAGELAKIQHIESRSPVRGIQVKAGGTQTFNLLAVDGTDDGAVNYDGLMVLQARGEGRASTPAAPLHAGEWQDVPCRFGVGQESRDAVCPVKLLELAPDLRRVRIYFSAVFTLPAFPAGFARKLADRGLYWSGPPDDQRLEDTWAGRPGIDLETWVEQSDRFARFFGEVYQATAAEPGWDLLMGYLPVLGEAGHGLTLTDPRQAGFTPERRDELERARRRVWQSVDRELARLLASLDMTKTVVVLVSDHGMVAIHTSLDPNALLKEQGLLAMDAAGRILPQGTAAYTVGSGGISQVYVAAGRRDLLPRLRKLFAEWTVAGERPIERILTRREAREIGLDHPDTGDLILFAREGYSISASTSYGMHGHQASHRSMHGIFLALGSGVKPGKTGPVRNLDVAGRVAAWLGMEKPRAKP